MAKAEIQQPQAKPAQQVKHMTRNINDIQIIS
jgi:hypothetical protein